MNLNLVERLKHFPWKKLNVEYAIIFGSQLRSPQPHDIDLAVKFKSYSFNSYLNLLEALSSFLKTREDHIDIVVLNREDLPCSLILEVYTRGMLLYAESFESFAQEALRRVNVCQDFMKTCRKLGLIEKTLKAVKQHWGSSKPFKHNS